MDEKRKVSDLQVEVRIINKTGKSALVQYTNEGALYSVYIPVEKALAGKVSLSELQEGIPYGEEWEKLRVKTFTSLDLAKELRNAGIFTLQDLLNQKQSVILTIVKLVGLTPQEIISQVKAQKKE